MNSPATMKTKDLELEAKSLDIKFEEDIERNDLIRLVADKRKEVEKASGNSTPKTDEKDGVKGNSGSKVVFYWIKMQSYVDDDVNKSSKLLPVGLYKFNKVLKRLEGSPISAVERFDNEIPERAILKIAEAVGIKYAASDDIDYEELLGKLVSDVKYEK